MSLSDFRPLPFLSNPHVQTVVGHFVSWTTRPPAAERDFVRLPDGDAVAVHENRSPQWQPGDDCVLLVHGLGGSHRSKYLQRIARRLLRFPLRVYRMDLRGAGDSATHCRRLYNAACSEDVRAVVEAIRLVNPESRVLLAGFSLGGNIVLKLAGEAATKPLDGLAAVAAVNAPIDLIHCSRLIQGYPLYDRFYVRGLMRQVRDHARVHPGVEVPVFPKTMTLRTFDDVYTAPRGGFRDAVDYYERASAAPLVPRIGVPAFLLTAKDDPFVAWEPYAELPRRDGQEIVIAPQGGHLGFLGRDGRGGIRWAETQVVEWLIGQMRR
jgi:predicted alpha/beta-fold hydrolase